MFGRYRGREYCIAYERVLDFGATETRIEWSVRIDGDRIPPARLNPESWTLDGLVDAVKRYVDDGSMDISTITRKAA